MQEKEGTFSFILLQDGVQLAQGGLFGDRDDAAREAWGDFHERRVDAWNETHFDNEKILGYRIDDDTYHPGCVLSPLPASAEELTLADDLANDFCSQCDSPILEDSVRDEYYDCNGGCECDLCMKVSDLVYEEPDRNSSYLLGYRVGLQHVLRRKIPSMTLEQYAFMRGLENTDFTDGYERGDREE